MARIVRTPRSSRSRFWIGSALALMNLTLATGGCASLLGIGDGKLEGEDAGSGGQGGAPGIVDEDTGLPTTEQCIEYCDLVMTNCTGEFLQYPERSTCIDTCNVLPAGDVEALGNTVQCRLVAARNAASVGPSELCPTAGPAGQDCGTKCEAWCTIFGAGCESQLDFLDTESCIAACEGLESNLGFAVGTAAESGDDLECRIYHATVSLADEAAADLHCRHAQIWAEPPCAETVDPTCGVYCQTVQAACRGDLAVYADEDECMAACSAFPLGEPRDGNGRAVDVSDNTVSCRSYHANAALTTPGTHCPHASPLGDGTCAGDTAQERAGGNCASFCLLYQEGCRTDFDGRVGSLATCEEQCLDTFGDAGAEAGSGYRVNALSAGSLQCHTHRAVQAIAAFLAEDEEARASFCLEVPAEEACTP